MYKVLIIDDEVLVRVGLKTTIDWEANGFTVVGEASNGEQGYEQYKKYLPDVIITDIKMPRKDGLWLIEKVKKENPDIRILVLTCYDEFSYARKALQIGVDDYILKSEVEDEELIAVMQSVKGRIDAQNSNRRIHDKDLANRNDIKKSIFNDMIKSDFNIEDKLLDRCRSIDFQVMDTRFAFASISINERPQQNQQEEGSLKQTSYAVFNIVFDLLTERTVEYIYNNQTGRYIFLLSSQLLNEFEMKRMFLSMNDSVKQYFDITLNIIYTDVFDNLAGACSMYKRFIEKEQILFYKGEGFSYIDKTDNISFSEPNVFNLKKQHNKRFIEVIGRENIEESIELINEIGLYFVQNNVNPKTIKIFCISLIGDIFNSYGVYFEGSRDLSNYEHYHYEIENSKRLQDIIYIFTDFTSKAINEIHNMRYNNPKAMINQAINFIQNHYDEKISLDDVAQKLNISKQYLCSSFKKVTGENMSLYINKLRIEKAKQLLLESDGRVKEIFDEVGYSNQQYFSKVFKKITGITVMEYKENRAYRQ